MAITEQLFQSVKWVFGCRVALIVTSAIVDIIGLEGLSRIRIWIRIWIRTMGVVVVCSVETI
jgi:hypothetical protein